MNASDIAKTVKHATGGASGCEGLGELRPTSCPGIVLSTDEFYRFESWAKATLGVVVERVLRRDDSGVLIVYGSPFIVELVRSLNIFPMSVRVVGGAS